jgi:hypothetical protein
MAKSLDRPCRYCGVSITMKMQNGKWAAFEGNKQHYCIKPKAKMKKAKGLSLRAIKGLSLREIVAVCAIGLLLLMAVYSLLVR